jgi:hypothetical protein
MAQKIVFFFFLSAPGVPAFMASNVALYWEADFCPDDLGKQVY